MHVKCFKLPPLLLSNMDLQSQVRSKEKNDSTGKESTASAAGRTFLVELFHQSDAARKIQVKKGKHAVVPPLPLR